MFRLSEVSTVDTFIVKDKRKQESVSDEEGSRRKTFSTCLVGTSQVIKTPCLDAEIRGILPLTKKLLVYQYDNNRLKLWQLATKAEKEVSKKETEANAKIKSILVEICRLQNSVESGKANRQMASKLSIFQTVSRQRMPL